MRGGLTPAHCSTAVLKQRAPTASRRSCSSRHRGWPEMAPAEPAPALIGTERKPYTRVISLRETQANPSSGRRNSQQTYPRASGGEPQEEVGKGSPRPGQRSGDAVLHYSARQHCWKTADLTNEGWGVPWMFHSRLPGHNMVWLRYEGIGKEKYVTYAVAGTSWLLC